MGKVIKESDYSPEVWQKLMSAGFGSQMTDGVASQGYVSNSKMDLYYSITTQPIRRSSSPSMTISEPIFQVDESGQRTGVVFVDNPQEYGQNLIRQGASPMGYDEEGNFTSQARLDAQFGIQYEGYIKARDIEERQTNDFNTNQFQETGWYPENRADLKAQALSNANLELQTEFKGYFREENLKKSMLWVGNDKPIGKAVLTKQLDPLTQSFVPTLAYEKEVGFFDSTSQLNSDTLKDIQSSNQFSYEPFSFGARGKIKDFGSDLIKKAGFYTEKSGLFIEELGHKIPENNGALNPNGLKPFLDFGGESLEGTGKWMQNKPYTSVGVIALGYGFGSVYGGVIGSVGKVSTKLVIGADVLLTGTVGFSLFQSSLKPKEQRLEDYGEFALGTVGFYYGTKNPVNFEPSISKIKEIGTEIGTDLKYSFSRLAADKSGSIGGRSARDRSGVITKAEKRKISFNQDFNRNVFYTGKEIGIRVRSKELKQLEISQRKIKYDLNGKTVTDIGLSSGLGKVGLSTRYSNKDSLNFKDLPNMNTRTSKDYPQGYGSQSLSVVGKGEINGLISIQKTKTIPYFEKMGGLNKRLPSSPRSPNFKNQQFETLSQETILNPPLEPVLNLPKRTSQITRKGWRTKTFERFQQRKQNQQLKEVVETNPINFNDFSNKLNDFGLQTSNSPFDISLDKTDFGKSPFESLSGELSGKKKKKFSFTEETEYFYQKEMGSFSKRFGIKEESMVFETKARIVQEQAQISSFKDDISFRFKDLTFPKFKPVFDFNTNTKQNSRFNIESNIKQNIKQDISSDISFKFITKQDFSLKTIEIPNLLFPKQPRKPNKINNPSPNNRRILVPAPFFPGYPIQPKPKKPDQPEDKIPGLPLIPFKMSFDNWGGGRKRTYKRKFKYAPDLASILTGNVRKGKAPKTQLTGLEVRPIFR